MTEIKATNITRHIGHVERYVRWKLLGQKGCAVWLTGLPSSGKSTAAFTIEHRLIEMGKLAYVLDGDNIRHGLNKNLGFSPGDRKENIRRIAEVAKLFADSGIITITSFISPYRDDRNSARDVHQEAGLTFLEVYIKATVETCEKRDPKNLYKKAREGKIKGFTGVDDPYEPPLHPEIVLDTSRYNPGQCAELVLAYMRENKLLEL